MAFIESAAGKAILDIVLTAAANGLAETLKVSDVLAACRVQGHEFRDEDLAPFISAGAASLAALVKVNQARAAGTK